MTDAMTLATLLPLLGTLIVAGAVIGLLAGLFGIGGGAISVPVWSSMQKSRARQFSALIEP